MEVVKNETQKLSWNNVDLMTATSDLKNKMLVELVAKKKVNHKINSIVITDEDFLEFVHKVTGDLITHLRKERGFRSEEEIEAVLNLAPYDGFNE